MKKSIYSLFIILLFCFAISKPVFANVLANPSPVAQESLLTNSQIPGSIKGLKVSNVSSNTINLTWRAVEGATNYNIYRSEISKGTFEYLGTSTTGSYIDEGLTASTKYYYKVSAVNGNGEGSKSNTVSASTKGILPGIVPDLSISSVGSNQVILTWGAVSDAKGYKVYYSASNLGPFKCAGTCKTTVYSNKGLKANTTYYYYVTAVNNDGEGSKSSILTVVTKGEAPGIVKNLKAVINNSNVVNLTWKAVDSATSYNIYRSVNKAGSFISIGTSSTESFSDEGLTANTKYYYKVSAVNTNGEGEQSNAAVITTKNSSVSTQSNYTALGDSIACGLSASPGKGYVNLFYNYLKGLPENADMQLDNLAVSGSTSSDLLSKLQDSKVKQTISESKVVTICIGSNNLLKPTIAALAAAFGLDPKDPNFAEELKNKLSDPANAGIFLKLMNPENLPESLADGVTQFNADWGNIVKDLRTLAPDSQVYVMTLYNPLSKDDNTSFYGQAFNLFDLYIKQINSTIMNSGNSFKVVDVYSPFLNNQGELLTGMSSFNPHPTDKGHELIYQAHLKAAVTGAAEAAA